MDNTTLSLSMGERVTLMHLLTNFKGDRPSTIMRKTKRIKYAIRYLEVPNGMTVVELLEDKTVLEAAVEHETLAWLWDRFQEFKEWPTQLDEWVPDLEDKLRAAVASKVKS
jgi:hypothetical protein